MHLHNMDDDKLLCQQRSWCSSLMAHGPCLHLWQVETANVLCHRWTSPFFKEKPLEQFQKTFGKPEADNFLKWIPAYMPDAQSISPVRQQTLNNLPVRPCMHLLQSCWPSLFVKCHGELLLHSCWLLHLLIEAGAAACAAVLFSPSHALNHSCLAVCMQPNSES